MYDVCTSKFKTKTKNKACKTCSASLICRKSFWKIKFLRISKSLHSIDSQSTKAFLKSHSFY